MRLAAVLAEVAPHLLGQIILQSAGVRLLLAMPDRVEVVEHQIALHLKFTSQLVNANLRHLFPIPQIQRAPPARFISAHAAY
jgi:hypothetical protein